MHMLRSSYGLLPMVCPQARLALPCSFAAAIGSCKALTGVPHLRCIACASNEADHHLAPLPPLPSLVAAFSAASTQTLNAGLHLVPTPIGARSLGSV